MHQFHGLAPVTCSAASIGASLITARVSRDKGANANVLFVPARLHWRHGIRHEQNVMEGVLIAILPEPRRGVTKPQRWSGSLVHPTCMCPAERSHCGETPMTSHQYSTNTLNRLDNFSHLFLIKIKVYFAWPALRVKRIAFSALTSRTLEVFISSNTNSISELGHNLDREYSSRFPQPE
jgi:hypothetical protein